MDYVLLLLIGRFSSPLMYLWILIRLEMLFDQDAAVSDSEETVCITVN